MGADRPSSAVDALSPVLPIVRDEKTSWGPPRPEAFGPGPLPSTGMRFRTHRDRARPAPEAQAPVIGCEPEYPSRPPNATDCRDSTIGRPAWLAEPLP